MGTPQIRNRLSKAVALTAVLAGLLIAVGYTPAQAAPKPRSGSLININYAMATNTFAITTIGLVYGIDQGYFKQEGIHVTMIPTENPVGALLSGNAQIALVLPDEAINADVAGANAKIIGVPMDVEQSVFIADSSITTLSGLLHKPFGVSQATAGSEEEVNAYLNLAHLSPSNMDYVAIGAPEARFLALIAGKIDATNATVLTCDICLSEIRQHKLDILNLPRSEQIKHNPLSMEIAEDGYISAHPTLIKRFLYAEFKGYVWALENPYKAAVDADTNTATPATGIGLAVMKNAEKSLANTHTYGIAGMSVKYLNEVENTLLATGEITKELPVSQIADVTPSQEVAKELLSGLSRKQIFQLLGTYSTTPGATPGS